MSDVDQDSKTELPTEKHLSEAREKGQFAKSPELSVVAMLAATVGSLSLTLSSAAHDVGSLAVSVFSQLGSMQVASNTIPSQLGDILIVIGKVLVPIMGASVLASLISGGVQSGFRFTPEVIGFRFENLDPSTGFSRHFSKAVLVHAGVDLLKLICIGTVLWVAARGLFNDRFLGAGRGCLSRPISLPGHDRVSFATDSALGVIAAISYAYEFYKSRHELMMSREEVKEERKQSEGDQLVKGACGAWPAVLRKNRCWRRSPLPTSSSPIRPTMPLRSNTSVGSTRRRSC